MKKILAYTILCAGLLTGSCAKDETTPLQGEGVVSFRLQMGNTENTRAYDPEENMLIRIYKEDGGLIRRYTSRAEMPDNLYLISGNYKIVVDAGDKSTATWTNKTYHGEKPFTVKANDAVTEQVVCPSVNVGAQVTYDQTILDKMDVGAFVYVSANNTFLLSEINEVPTLKYELSETPATGYFLLPEGTTNLSWGFYGEGTELGKVEQTGVVENVESASVYQLKFQYSKTPDGSVSISVLVDKSADEFFDNIIFSPQPTITGDGFPMSGAVGFHDADIRFGVTSVKPLKQITMTAGGTQIPIFDLDNAITLPVGVVCESIDANNLKITLQPAFFTTYQTGIHPIDFYMLDTDGGEGEGAARVAMPGLLPIATEDYNLWGNTASFKAIVTDPAATSVQIAYRTADGAWKSVPAVQGADCIYTAAVEPSWTSQQNAGGHTIYTHDKQSGIFANNNYEYKLILDGTDNGNTMNLSTAVQQSIPDGNMENSGLSCFTQSNNAAPFWASGNNSATKTLCTQSSFVGQEGAHCAKLAATSAMGVLAAGNLLSGLFYKDGLMKGVVEFGQPYDWKARPTALKLKYYVEKMGLVNIASHSGAPIGEGDQDRGRIFAAVIDWNSRHIVTSGTAAPTGVWDPEKVTSTAEGRIIGYGSLMLDKASTGGQMLDLEIPIHYYDKTAKPSGRYTVIISCATSAYGDYMVGNDGNLIYVDDFNWVY